MTTTTLPPAPYPRKRSSWDCECERDKLLTGVTQFFSRVGGKLDKAVSKELKRCTLLCKEIFSSLEMHPQQEPYELTRLNDWLFAQTELFT